MATKTTKKIKKSASKPSTSVSKKIESTNKLEIPANFSSINTKKIRLIAILLLIVALVVIRRDIFIAATVNGEPISRLQVIKDLEKQNGKSTLENLITKKLILQEAEKRNIKIEDKELTEELKTIEANVKGQGMTLDQALQAQSMTRAQLNEEIEIQLLLEKMIEKNIKISKEEIEKFATDNKDQFPAGTSAEDINKQSEEQLKNQKSQTERQKLIEELQKKAKINNFVSY